MNSVDRLRAAAETINKEFNWSMSAEGDDFWRQARNSLVARANRMKTAEDYSGASFRDVFTQWRITPWKPEPPNATPGEGSES